MAQTAIKKPLIRRAAIVVTCLIALAIFAVSAFVIVLALFKAHQIDTSFVMQLVYAAAVALIALALFDGARRWPRWAIWPAIALFLVIALINAVKAVDYIRNPVPPAGGFATQADLAERDQNILSAILRPTEAEYLATRRTAIATYGLLLILITTPSLILLILRRRDALQ